MPATKTSATRPRATPAARTRTENDVRRLDHISRSLEAAQKDVSSIGVRVGTGVRDLRRDVTRLLRDARRDLLKMQRAIQRDLTRLETDLTAAATVPAARAIGPRRPPCAPPGTGPSRAPTESIVSMGRGTQDVLSPAPPGWSPTLRACAVRSHD
jgi:hypothetical protein